MVGIPRSKGCRICVQRRVKCDQTRPVCNNCLKGNRPCPGYDSDLRIQDEGTKLRKRFGKHQVSDSKPDSSSNSPETLNSTSTEDSSPEKSTEITSRDASVDPESLDRRAVFRPSKNYFLRILEREVSPGATASPSTNIEFFEGFVGLLSGADSPLAHTPPEEVDHEILSGHLMDLDAISQPWPRFEQVYSPLVVQEQLLSNFSSSLGTPGGMILPKEMQNHSRWLSQLPQVFGNRLLDSAVRAVSLVHLGRMQRADAFVNESRLHYGKALRLLNRSLLDSDEGMSSETLSATVLLSFYEMFASSSNESWVRHAGGAGTLMRIRGPARHLKGLDRDIFLAYRHTIIIDAFQRDEPCFLEEPEWIQMSQQVHEQLARNGMQSNRIQIFDLAEEFYINNVRIPRTFRDARQLGQFGPSEGSPGYQDWRADILHRAQQHRQGLKDIYVRFRAALQRSNIDNTIQVTNDPVFPIQYRFINVFVGSTSVGYWTIMILLNIILKELERDQHPEMVGLYLMENREIACEICRATPFMLTSSFLGPFFIIFALRLNLMVFEPSPERDWVVQKLFHIGHTHMRMAADIPGFRPDESDSIVATTSPTTFDVRTIKSIGKDSD